jgi:hypothetical protein
MKHPMLRYWESAYSDFRVGVDSYFVPQMTDPIISAHFREREGSSFNLIQDLNAPVVDKPRYKIRNDFYLGRFKARDLLYRGEFKVLELSEVKDDQNFWGLMNDGFADTVAFLEGFMKFLPSLKAKFKVAYLLENGFPYACAVIGIAADVAVLLSTVIKSTHRDQLKSRNLEQLIHMIAGREKVQECFFWTKSEKLTKYADHVDRYLIYIHKGL